MTLTEEQREAIRVISKLPMAIGCQLCHPYIMENYGSHFIVLRDMIDSSGTVEPTGGFDLEKVRAVLEEAIDRMSLTVSDEDGPIWEADPEQTAILQEMLDRIGRYTNNDYLDLQYQLDSADAEIERLRAENLELQVAVFGPDGIRANQACIIADQAARISDLEIEIAELKSDLEQSEEIKRLKDELENYGDHYACLLISKDAQIKELEGMLSIRTEELDIAHSVARSEKEMHEKELAAFARRIKELEEALVEMVATNPCNIPTLCDVVHDELMCPALDGNCDFWKGCPQKNELREAARKQLQAEGKIGPDAKPRSWQITEERKTMLSHCLEVVDYVATTKAYSDAIRDRDTIRAMLEENL